MKLFFVLLTLTSFLQGSEGQVEENEPSSLLSVESTGIRLSNKERTRAIPRALGHYSKSKSSKKSSPKILEANLPRILEPNLQLEATLRNDDGDQLGEALIEFDGDDMTIDIELDDLPPACDDGDCFIAIERDSRCGAKSAKSAKRSFYFDGGRSAGDSDNPWTPFDSDFESDDGEASFDFETSNGKDYDGNKDRVMVIYAKKPQDPVVAVSAKKSPKSSKSHKSESHHSASNWDLDDYNDVACGKLNKA